MKNNNVKRLRKSMKISQNKMAEDLNISSTKISEWELGKRKITKKDAEMLGEYFNVSAAYVTGDSMYRYDVEDGFFTVDDIQDEFYDLDFDEMEILECYRYMGDNGKFYLMQTVRMLKKFYGMND